MLLMQAHVSAHCGCPEELILVGAGELLIHYEDGAADCYIDWGDEGDAEASFPCATQFEGRVQALRWARTFAP